MEIGLRKRNGKWGLDMKMSDRLLILENENRRMKDAFLKVSKIIKEFLEERKPSFIHVDITSRKISDKEIERCAKEINKKLLEWEKGDKNGS